MAFIVKSKVGSLGQGSSVSLPQAGLVQLGKPINGSKNTLQSELDQFYPGQFEVVNE